MGEYLKQDVQSKVAALPGVGGVDVEVVFDPPWNQSMMSEAASSSWECCKVGLNRRGTARCAAAVRTLRPTHAERAMAIEITADTTMGEILQAYPAAKVGLFQRYHIGGCSACSYQPTDTVARYV
jgi:metal-sulfur cluster biosynthetic enzyme